MNLQIAQNINSDFLKEFLAGRSPNTIQSYKDDLEAFSKFTKSSDAQSAICSLIASTQGEANRTALCFRNYMKDTGKSPATINRKLATIRSCVKFARLCGFINWNIEVQNLKSESYRDTSGPGLQSFRKIINNLKKSKNIKALRDIAMLRLMFDLGLRVSELININFEDVKIDKSMIFIKGKGQHEKQGLSLPNETVDSIQQWIKVRGTGPGALFINFSRSSTPSRISRIGVYNIVSKLSNDVGYKTRPHGIRHTAITEACKMAQSNGLPLEDVLDFSRHKSISTLLIYKDKENNKQADISSLVAKQIN